MARNVLCVLCVWLVTASLLAAAEPADPGVPPQFAVVTKLDADAGEVELRLVARLAVMEWIEQIVSDPDTDKVETQRIPRVRYVSEVRARRIKLADARVMTAAQKVIDLSEVAERLKPDTAVLLQDSDQKLDTRYLATLKDETLLLIVKREPPPSLGTDDGFWRGQVTEPKRK